MTVALRVRLLTSASPFIDFTRSPGSGVQLRPVVTSTALLAYDALCDAKRNLLFRRCSRLRKCGARPQDERRSDVRPSLLLSISSLNADLQTDTCFSLHVYAVWCIELRCMPLWPGPTRTVPSQRGTLIRSRLCGLFAYRIK
jgi:hypothetical protein